MNKGLKARLRRLERRLDRRPFPRVMAGIFDKAPEDIVGYEGERDGTRLTILRQTGEALETLQARAWELVSARSLFTVYAPSAAGQGEEAAPAEALALKPVRAGRGRGKPG